jgi:hypothetical protein
MDITNLSRAASLAREIERLENEIAVWQTATRIHAKVGDGDQGLRSSERYILGDVPE